MELDHVPVGVSELRASEGCLPERGDAPSRAAIVGTEYLDAAYPNGVGVRRVHRDYIVIIALPARRGDVAGTGAIGRGGSTRIAEQQRVRDVGVGIRYLSGPGAGGAA